jgi:hypothetical protein
MTVLSRLIVMLLVTADNISLIGSRKKYIYSIGFCSLKEGGGIFTGGFMNAKHHCQV